MSLSNCHQNPKSAAARGQGWAAGQVEAGKARFFLLGSGAGRVRKKIWSVFFQFPASDLVWYMPTKLRFQMKSYTVYELIYCLYMRLF